MDYGEDDEDDEEDKVDDNENNDYDVYDGDDFDDNDGETKNGQTTLKYHDFLVKRYDDEMKTIDETSLGQAKGPPLSPEQAEIP